MSQTIDIRDAPRLGVQIWAVLSALYVGLLIWATRGQSHFADGYDGIGFVLAVQDFDLSRFQPHPPGFPLLVLFSRWLHAIPGVAPALAVALCSALLLPLGLAAMSIMLALTSGRFAAWLFALLAGPHVLVWGMGTATLSDGAGLGLTLAALCSAAGALWAGRAWLAWVSGCLAGCALGVRPQAVVLLALGLITLLAYVVSQRRALGRPLWVFGASAGFITLAWLLPLASLVGPGRLVQLCLQHARGHFTDFGGRALRTAHEPGFTVSRLLELLHTLAGALGPLLFLGLVLAGLWLLRHRLVVSRRVYVPSALVLAITASYLAYALLAVRVIGDGRHLLPLPIGVAAALAPLLALAAQGRVHRTLGVLTLCVGALVNARAVFAFRHSPTEGAQLAAALADCGTPVYGARAARYVDLRCGSGTAQPAIYLGEVLSDIERRSNPPREVFVTSEVIASASSQQRLRLQGRFCRATDVPSILRFDAASLLPRAAGQPKLLPGCVDLFAYRVLP